MTVAEWTISAKIQRQKVLKCRVLTHTQWGVRWTSIASLIGCDCRCCDVNVKRCQIAPTSAAAAAARRRRADTENTGPETADRTFSCSTSSVCGLSHFCEPYVDPSLSTGSYTAAMKEPHDHKTLSVSVTIINYLTFTYKMTTDISYILLSRLR